MFNKILCLEYQSHLLAVVCDCCRDVFTHHFVHVEHVQVNPEIENWRNLSKVSKELRNLSKVFPTHLPSCST